MDRLQVVITGRPNVGKSSLFNRILGKRKAIVDDIPQTTRDRLISEVEWKGKKFILVDTGGIITFKEEGISQEVQEQVNIALKEAFLFLFVVDGKTGLTPQDLEISKILRKNKKPTILVVNKIDNKEREKNISEFYKLGYEEIIPVSAIHGRNIGELLDLIVEKLPDIEKTEQEKSNIKIAIVGRPNVGKSSILNCILGEERVLVNPLPGTTRDAIDTEFSYNGESFILIDTAGIRKKKKIKERLEYYCVKRALKAIENSEIAALVVDAKEGPTEQDKKILGYAKEKGKGILILVNKWDLIMGKWGKKVNPKKIERDYLNLIRKEFDFVSFAPVIFTSAVTLQGIKKILDRAIEIKREYGKRIDTSELNKLLEEAKNIHQTPSSLKIYYISQIKTSPPTFLLSVNEESELHFSYLRFLENKIREKYIFKGVPLKFILKRR
jgi:GTP-binding protein